MTSTITRRSATALSAVALAALLGTPAHAAGNDGTPGNETSAAAQSSDHGQPADAGNAGGNEAPGQADKADAPAEDKGGKPESAGKPEAAAKTQPAAKPAKATAENTDGGYRGKSPSTPDQDGVGMDRGLDNNDKTGPGTDGNNGCGNDDDREDDNNGWCGRKPKKVRAAAPAVAVSTRTLSGVVVAAPVAAPAPVAPAAPIRTVVESAPVVRGAVQPIAPAAVAGVRIVAARPAPSVLQQATLPYTGSNAQTLMVLGVVLVAGGLVVREIARSAEAMA